MACSKGGRSSVTLPVRTHMGALLLPRALARADNRPPAEGASPPVDTHHRGQHARRRVYVFVESAPPAPGCIPRRCAPAAAENAGTPPQRAPRPRGAAQPRATSHAFAAPYRTAAIATPIRIQSDDCTHIVRPRRPPQPALASARAAGTRASQKRPPAQRPRPCSRAVADPARPQARPDPAHRRYARTHLGAKRARKTMVERDGDRCRCQVRGGSNARRRLPRARFPARCARAAAPSGIARHRPLAPRRTREQSK
jgi:hypothetical protein